MVSTCTGDAVTWGWDGWGLQLLGWDKVLPRLSCGIKEGKVCISDDDGEGGYSLFHMALPK